MVLAVFMALREIGVATDIVTTAFAILFGAIFPTLAAWFIVAPLKHMPIAGWNPKTTRSSASAVP